MPFRLRPALVYKQHQQQGNKVPIPLLVASHKSLALLQPWFENVLYLLKYRKFIQHLLVLKNFIVFYKAN